MLNHFVTVLRLKTAWQNYARDSAFSHDFRVSVYVCYILINFEIILNHHIALFFSPCFCFDRGRNGLYKSFFFKNSTCTIDINVTTVTNRKALPSSKQVKITLTNTKVQRCFSTNCKTENGRLAISQKTNRFPCNEECQFLNSKNFVEFATRKFFGECSAPQESTAQ